MTDLSVPGSAFKKGKNFEERLVQALLGDHKFAEQMVEILNVDYFGLEYLKESAKILFDYYGKYKAFPSFEVFKTIVMDTKDDTLRERMLIYLEQVRKEPLNGDMEWTKENALEFCRKRRVMLSLEKILEFAENKKYNDIVPEIQKALVAGSERDMGHSLLEDFEARMQKSTYKPVPTPWALLNNLIKGGVGGGKLACVCAPTGVGKSHALVEIGVAAAAAGYTVVHYTFELSENDTGNRYDSRIADISIDTLLEHKQMVLRQVQAIPGKIIIKSYPTKTATVATIRNHLHKLHMKDIRPDLIIIDYADLMRSRNSYEQRRMEEESVYEELRALAMELDLPIWTATQSNRGGLDAEVITLKDIAECFAKAMICDLFVTMNRKKDGSDYTNFGNFFVAKNRMGRDGVKFPMLIHTGKSKIEVLPPEVLEDDDDDQGGNGNSRLKKKWKEYLKGNGANMASPSPVVNNEGNAN